MLPAQIIGLSVSLLKFFVHFLDSIEFNKEILVLVEIAYLLFTPYIFCFKEMTC